MINRLMAAFVFLLLFIAIDLYFFQAILSITSETSKGKWIRYIYWIPTVLSIVAMLWWIFDDPFRYSANLRNWVITGLLATYLSKTLGIIILFIGDLTRLFRWLSDLVTSNGKASSTSGQLISRSQFFSIAAVAGASIPMSGFVFGIISGAHDYRVRRVRIPVKGLTPSLEGITIGQISDIHSGSFWNKTAVMGGVDMLLREKPDLITFTGDLVNNETAEVRDYIPVFNRLRAPLGVYSVTGNHDYGDYRSWSTLAEKQTNFRDLIAAHGELGFRLLLNAHHRIQTGSFSFEVIGVENWGAGRFAKYGKLKQAIDGTADADFRLLLSHDPSHWDAEVRKESELVELTLSGHTHGFQFGVEAGGFKWSPSQYIYKQWAGHYQDGLHHLYVNRGFGYLAYPGRVGIPPELTILELVRA